MGLNTVIKGRALTFSQRRHRRRRPPRTFSAELTVCYFQGEIHYFVSPHVLTHLLIMQYGRITSRGDGWRFGCQEKSPFPKGATCYCAPEVPLLSSSSARLRRRWLTAKQLFFFFCQTPYKNLAIKEILRTRQCHHHSKCSWLWVCIHFITVSCEPEGGIQEHYT